MIVAVDVGYRGSTARAAAVAFARWDSAEIATRHVVVIDGVADYVPGEFYRRELPCIMKVLEGVPDTISTVLIDGYVWLDPADKPGLGARLWETLNRRVPVVGVAKTAFAGAPDAWRVFRGASRQPLFVTAAGMEGDEARHSVQAMSGAHRIPDLLKAVDRLSRGVG